MIMNRDLITFANGNTDFYEAAVSAVSDYNNCTLEKKDLTQTAFLAEIERKSGVSREGNDFNAWCSHPSVQWAEMSILRAVIPTIVSTVILPDMNIFSDIRSVGAGDMVRFTLNPKSFYTVSLDSKAQRNTFRVRKFAQDIELYPIMHVITTYEKYYNVLSGKVNVVDFLNLVALSLRSAMFEDQLKVLNDGLGALPVGDNNVTGAFDMRTLVKICETVQYRNGGVKPIIAGSATALMNVLPDSTSGYRMNVDGEGSGKIELLRTIMGYSVLKMENAVSRADGKLILPDNKLYVVSPSQDKLIKGVVETGLNNSSDYLAHADLTSEANFRQGWKFMFATAAECGVYTMQ